MKIDHIKSNEAMGAKVVSKNKVSKLQMKIDHIYIITINNTPENYGDTINRIIDIGLPNECTYEFVGVNGYDIKQGDLDKMGVRLYDKWNASNFEESPLDTDNKFWYKDMTKGEIGCALSHMQIWEDAYEKKYDNIIIFEDDVINDGQPFDWNVLQDIKHLNYDLFYLGRVPQGGFAGVEDVLIEEHPLICKPGYSYQAHAYMLSRTGLIKIVEDYLPILKNNLVPSDEFLPAICNWTPRLDLNELFPGYIRGFGLVEWDDVGVLQMRNDISGNSTTSPEYG